MDEFKDKEPAKHKTDFEKGFRDYISRCSEVEKRSEKGEERCLVLELEIEKRKSDYELLEGKFRALEVQNLTMEDEIKVLKSKNGELEGRIARVEDENKVDCGKERVVEVQRVVDLTEENEEEDKVVQLMIENKVLECEKKKAEDEVEVWKEKFRELESRVVCLEKDSLILRGGQYSSLGQREEELGLRDISSYQEIDAKGTIEANTPSIVTPHKHSVHVKGKKRRGTHLETEVVDGSQVRKKLAYRDEGCPSKKMAPSTPVGARPASVCVIDVNDSDDELDITNIHMPTTEIHGNKMVCFSTDHALGGAVGNEKGMTFENSLKRTLPDQSDEEDMSGCKGNHPFIITPQRKRASNIVTSDSESDDDDNLPICKLKKKYRQESIHDATDSHLNSCSPATVSRGTVEPESVTPRRGRLMTVRQCEERGWAERDSPNHPGIPTTEDGDDDEMEEVGSESASEGESLGGFIVDGSDVTDNNVASSESEDVSDGNVDFDEILSRIRRIKDQNSKWEFEADMLAAFGKDSELCMKAVCALYRQQTTDEKSIKETIHSNQRGFSQCDALRGTTLAEFLTDGDPHGNLMKSVKELQEYDSKALELCRTLASHYSKQLFAIYKNKEDPYFLPS